VSQLPTSLPGIDVASALARVAGNAALYVKLLRLMAAGAPSSKEKLAAALASGDAEAVRQEAHSIKGAAANLSITEVTETSARLELAARSGDAAAMKDALAALEKALEAYVAVVDGI
jgi:HPt (histidine-containing phosphotransfer) domain-containing protein